MYHLKLVKGLSYCGIVSATKKKPDVFVNDKTVADLAVATGYFVLVEGAEAGEGAEEKAEDLKDMEYNDLKKLAADLGIDTKVVKKKADLIAAIEAAREEGTEAGEDNNEVDYGEGENNAEA